MSELEKALKTLMAMEHNEVPKPDYMVADNEYARITESYRAAIRMVREAVQELFGPVASLESEEAVLLRGPEPHHDAEAIITALQRVKEMLEAHKRVQAARQRDY